MIKIYHKFCILSIRIEERCIIAGIRKNYKVLRASSMLLFIGCLGKIYMVDIAGLNTLHKVIAFLLTGILFLGGAAAYIIFRKRFSEDKK